MILIYNICKDQGKDGAQGLEKSPGFLKKTFMFSLSQRPAQSPVSDSNPRNGALLPGSDGTHTSCLGKTWSPRKRGKPRYCSDCDSSNVKRWRSFSTSCSKCLKPGQLLNHSRKRRVRICSSPGVSSFSAPFPAPLPCPSVYCKPGNKLYRS